MAQGPAEVVPVVVAVQPLRTRLMEAMAVAAAVVVGVESLVMALPATAATEVWTRHGEHMVLAAEVAVVESRATALQAREAVVEHMVEEEVAGGTLRVPASALTAPAAAVLS